MKKWMIGLSILGSLTTLDSYSQVYNQKLEKRYSNEIKSAEEYQKHIQKLESRLFTDYYNFLDELNYSEAYSRIELMRQDRLKRLKDIRFDLNDKIDYDRQFNDSRHSITNDFNILLDHYSTLYTNDYKEHVELNRNIVDSLHEFKSYLSILEPIVKRSSKARSKFISNFSKFEKEYDLAPENESNIESYSPTQRKIYSLVEKINKAEELSIYLTKINVRLITLESIDNDFILSAEDFDSLGMADIIRYQSNHSKEAFTAIQSMGKFNNIENTLKNNALRVVKNHISNSQKIYVSILKFSDDNRRVLIQERKNIEEYTAVSVDKSKFESESDRLLYVGNRPSQKFTEKYKNLIFKYREKTDKTIAEYNASSKELIRTYVKKYNPIKQNF